MFQILFSFYFLITLSFAMTIQEPKRFCVHCKYFIPATNYFIFMDNEYSKCRLFPKTSNIKSNYLVTGVYYRRPAEYYYCSTAREIEEMCGTEGKKYISKSKEEEEKDHLHHII